MMSIWTVDSYGNLKLQNENFTITYRCSTQSMHIIPLLCSYTILSQHTSLSKSSFNKYTHILHIVQNVVITHHIVVEQVYTKYTISSSPLGSDNKY